VGTVFQTLTVFNPFKVSSKNWHVCAFIKIVFTFVNLKTNQLGWKENQEIQNVRIENTQGNIIVDQRQARKILENYITELYDRANGPENREV
jgi:hypothetical protein